MEEFEFAILPLDQSSAGVHPVTVVIVEDVTVVVDFSPMSRSASHAINFAPMSFAGDCILEIANELHTILDAVLDQRGQRLVGEPQAPPGHVEPTIHVHEPVLDPVAQRREQLAALHDRVEFVAVEDQQPLCSDVRSCESARVGATLLM